MGKADMGKPNLDESKINLPHPYWCLILSGPEPQRSMLFEKVTEALSGIRLVVLCGSPAPRCRKNPDNITGATDPDNITVITNPGNISGATDPGNITSSLTLTPPQ